MQQYIMNRGRKLNPMVTEPKGSTYDLPLNLLFPILLVMFPSDLLLDFKIATSLEISPPKLMLHFLPFLLVSYMCSPSSPTPIMISRPV
jgi:hypothetical protein